MKLFKDILRGILIGIANAIPGVSGGTMMVSMGIYDEIISCITGLFKHLKKSILTLLPYIIGMALGIVGLSFIITGMFTNYPLQTGLLFIGLILGGLPILFRHIQIKSIGISGILAFLVFFTLIIGMQLLGGKSGADASMSLGVVSFIKLFFVGIIASATMVIPGVSGSMMMMLLGYYEPIMRCIKETVTCLKNGDIMKMIETCLPLIPFAIGVALGIFAVAKLIELLLNKFETMTYCAILGLVVASPIVVLMNTFSGETGSKPVLGVLTILASIVTFIIGFVVAFFLGNDKTDETESDTI